MIAGIDCAKNKIAVVRYEPEEDRVEVFTYICEEANRCRQLASISGIAREATSGCEVVWIEEALVGRNTRSSLHVAVTTGAVAAGLSVKAYFVPVKAWKRKIIGNGNANKGAIALWLNANHETYAEQCGDDQDLIDATCIALYGHRIQTVAASLGLDRY